MRPSGRSSSERLRERAGAGRAAAAGHHAVRAGLAVQPDVDGRQVGRALPQHRERAGRHVVDVVDLRELAGEPVQQLRGGAGRRPPRSSRWRCR